MATKPEPAPSGVIELGVQGHEVVIAIRLEDKAAICYLRGECAFAFFELVARVAEKYVDARERALMH